VSARAAGKVKHNCKVNDARLKKTGGWYQFKTDRNGCPVPLCRTGRFKVKSNGID
jgi:hypothetical protein